MASSTSTPTLDQWQILFQKTMEALQHAQEAVKRQFGFWARVNGLWRCARDLKDLGASLKAISELPDGTLNDEFLQSQIPRLHKLLKSIDDLLEIGKRKGLANRTVIGASLGLISVRGEYIADYLDALEMTLDPLVIAAIDEGRSQIERGDAEVMERLF
jgi:hypothetical protein